VLDPGAAAVKYLAIVVEVEGVEVSALSALHLFHAQNVSARNLYGLATSGLKQNLYLMPARRR
jgi:hypothetical protein